MGFIREQYFKNKNAIDQEAATWRAEQQSKGPQVGSVPSWANMPSVQPSRHHMADLQRQADDYNAQVRNYQRQQAAFQTYQDRMGMDVEQGKKELVLRSKEMTNMQTMRDMLDAQDWEKRNPAIQKHLDAVKQEYEDMQASTADLRTRLGEAEAYQAAAQKPMTATEANKIIEDRDAIIDVYEKWQGKWNRAEQERALVYNDPNSTDEQKRAADAMVAQIEAERDNVEKLMHGLYQNSDEAEYVSARDKQLSDPRYDAYYTHARTLQSDLEKVQAVSHYLQYGAGDPKKVLEEYTPYLSEKYGFDDKELTAEALTALYERLKSQRDKEIGELTAAGYNYERMAEYEAQQKANEEAARHREWVREQALSHPVAMSLISVGENLMSGADFVTSALQSIGRNDPTDPTTYRAPQATDYEHADFVNTVRGTVANEVIDSEVGSFLYQTGMSMADSLAALGVSSVAGIPKAATVLMGMSAAGHTAKDIVDRGGTSQQAFWGGLTAGALEALMEKVPLDQLLNIGSVDSLKAMLKGVLKQGATEAGEEILTEIANNIFDGFIMGDKSNYNLTVRQLMDDNPLLTKEEAQRDAAMMQVEQVAMAGLGGFVSGLGFGGAANVGSYVANRNVVELQPVRDEIVFKVGDVCTMVGVDTASGKPIYEANFPKGTPKKEKGQHILYLIQNVWSKQPIKLTIPNEDGSVRTIYAQFDPTYSEDENVKTDASKLMGGNRHGSSSDQRVTLDLADDYYQIASEAKYNYSKDESGKDSDTHKDVKQWHYFVDDILFREYGEKTATPYRVTVNIKEKPDGHFVYSFSAEKTEEGSSTRRTLHADVNQADETGRANATTFDFTVPQPIQPVNGNNSQNNQENDLAFLLDNESERFEPETDSVGYKAYYEAGLSGAPMESVTNIRGSELTQEQKQAAYERGRREAAESLVRETANARFTPSYGNNAHLVDNEYSKKLSKQTRDTLNDLARMTGVNIEVADMEDGINGSYDPKTGTMKINAKVKNAALVVAAHEVTHRMQQAAPQEYRQYRDYVVNAISQKIGRSALEYTMERYARQGIELTTEEAMDELASDFAMDMVRDGKLFQDLMQKHRNTAQVLLDSVKAFLSKVKSLFWHSYAVQNSVTHDHFGVEMETLENAVRMWENAMNATRQQVEGKEIAAQTDGGEKRFALGGKGFATDKYYERLIDRWKQFADGHRIRVGRIRAGSALNQVGMPVADLYYDVGKIKKTLEKHGDHIDENVLKNIPDILNDPIVITEFTGSDGSVRNTVNVFGNLFVNNSPMLIGVVMHLDSNGQALVTNIRTVHARRDAIKQITDNSVLYLNKDKRKTRSWFHDCGNLNVPLAGTKYGLIRSISFVSENSNTKNSVTETETFRANRAKELMDKYGTIYPGENPHRKASVPRKTSGKEFVSQTIRTVIEAKATPDAAVPTLEELAADGEFSYERYTDQQAMDDARDTITHLGYQGALTSWTNAVERGKVSKKNTALGWELYRQAANANDMESAVTILNLMVEHQRNAAQALQATRILKKMDPDAQLYGVQKSVSRLQEELKAKFKDKAPELKISTALAEQFLNAETDEARAKVLNAMYADIGRQIPSTFKEKWDNWRYLAMLANPRTHIRNFFGNAAFVPVRGIGNQLSALGQLTLPKEQRTRSLGFNISAERKALVDAAKNDFETNTGELVMSGDKYNSATNIIDKNKRVFQFKPLEAARKGNGNLLEREDKIFSKQAYVSALAGYLNARGYTAQDFTGDGMTQQQKDDARSFAIKEAQKATYRDANAFSDLVTSIGFKKPKNGLESGINALVEGVLPFKKTPANILVRAFEYSPAGLTKTVLVDGIRAKKGSISANEFIDNMSKGLTGSAVFALGMLLAKWDVIKLQASPEDEEQSELEGRQTYSLEIGGKSITLDWAAPGVIPLFMGVELKNAIDELTAGESISLADIADVFSALTGPMENMSMLDGLNSTIESAAIAAQNDQSAIGSAIGTAALNYFTQAFPTIFGQIERAIAKNEWVRQTTFIDKESEIPTGLQYTLGRVGNKIPGFDFAQVPCVDAWGRTQDNGNVAVRAANNMLNPSYISDIEETDVDREIKRLEEATGENFTPSRVKNNKLSVNGKTVFLTEDEFFTYATAKGQNDLIFRESLLNDPKYEALDDAVKGKLQNASEEYAKVLAMQEAGLKPELSEWQEELQDADIQTITDKLFLNAIDSTAKAKGKELGGGKYDGLAWLYDEGQIGDNEAYLSMSNTMQDAYNAHANNGKTFNANDMIDIYAAATRDKNLNTEEQYNVALQEIDKLWKNDSQKAIALSNAFGEVFEIRFPEEQEAPAAWQAKYGQAGQRNILANMSDSQKEQYGWIMSNYGDAGITPYMFETASAYKNKQKNTEKNGKVVYKASDKFADWLDATGWSVAQKKAVWYSMYKSRSRWG